MSNLNKVDVLIVGLPRNAKQNKINIEKNILLNFDVQNTIEVYSDETVLENPRSGDYGTMDKSQYYAFSKNPTLLDLNRDSFFSGFSQILLPKYDPWNDDSRSLRNFLKYLKCLDQSYVLWSQLENPSDTVIVLRPDIIYDDLNNTLICAINKVMNSYNDFYLTSVFQAFGGVNDRFAILKGTAIKPYLTRIGLVNIYVETNSNWNSEKFLGRVMSGTSAKHFTVKLKLYRTRANGDVADERFHVLTSGSIKAFLKNYGVLI